MLIVKQDRWRCAFVSSDSDNMIPVHHTTTTTTHDYMNSTQHADWMQLCSSILLTVESLSWTIEQMQYQHGLFEMKSNIFCISIHLLLHAYSYLRLCLKWYLRGQQVQVSIVPIFIECGCVEKYCVDDKFERNVKKQQFLFEWVMDQLVPMWRITSPADSQR